ncbi:hypothetical protein [Streptomyces sp. NPDC054826]
MNHLPTVVAGQHAAQPPAPGAPAHPAGPQNPPAYGHPQQHPGYGAPYSGPYGGHGATPPYGPPPFTGTPPYGPPRDPRRDARSTALLVVIALVVALAAGGTVYALMSNGDTGAGGGPSASPSASGDAAQGDSGATPSDGKQPGTDGPGTTTAPDGTVPADYLGSWSATIDNASGVHSRRLTIQQGGVGDTVMSLLAEGPTGNGTYRCVFEARLTSASDSGGLQLGPSSVTSGRPRSACTPGAATQVRLLPGDTLQRVNTSSGEQLTYTRD